MRRVFPYAITILGFVILLAYLNFAFGWVVLSDRLAIALAFAIGPVAIFGTLGLSERLKHIYDESTLRIGTTFIVIAFSLLTLMLTMQQSVFAEYEHLSETAVSSEPATALEDSFALVNHIQLGTDVAFDIFYALGIIFISGLLVQKNGLGRIVGIYGLLAAGGLLALNIWYFPTPPAAAESIDLGPYTIAWWVGLIIFDSRLKKRGVYKAASET